MEKVKTGWRTIESAPENIAVLIAFNQGDADYQRRRRAKASPKGRITHATKGTDNR